jgi:hypothetical protein
MHSNTIIKPIIHCTLNIHRFLKYQYYATFVEDPEVAVLHRMNVLSSDKSPKLGNDLEAMNVPTLSVGVLKKRLVLFLKVFAAVISPKQLFQHQQLYNYYCSILSKPDADVVKLAVDCLMTYKVAAITSYKETLYNFLDDSTMRNELLTFDATVTTGVVNSDHRAVFIPVLVRLLYGRFVSRGKGGKSAREQALARRNAVLSFFSKLPGAELDTLVNLMLRGVVPREKMEALAASENIATESERGDKVATLPVQDDERIKLSAWHASVIDMILTNISATDLRGVMWERQIGFLYLMEQAIKLIGFGMTNYVHIFNHMISLLLAAAHSDTHKRALISSATGLDSSDDEEADRDDDSVAKASDDEDAVSDDEAEVASDYDAEDNMGEEDKSGSQGDTSAIAAVQSARVRVMCVRRLTGQCPFLPPLLFVDNMYCRNDQSV